ncbi:MAG: radical SAM protein [Angelakisella sp.]
MESCNLCPRRCGVDRSVTAGACGGGALARVAAAMLHYWEEPCISGTRGSGTVFFSGCPLGCCFCQNAKLSRDNFGAEVSSQRLSQIFLELQEQGAHNLNLVSPTQYVPQIMEALALAKPQLTLPVVYNTGGYELPETLRLLDGLVDIYLPDFKYLDSARSQKYSGAADYPACAAAALEEMFRQTGPCQMGEDGLLRSGVVVRHLVLPGGRADSLAIVRYLAGRYGKQILLSLMSQYTPQHYNGDYKELHRPVSSYEYNAVVALADELGMTGFMQQRTSAKPEYTPDFTLQGVIS